jgi:hypothetical protein
MIFKRPPSWNTRSVIWWSQRGTIETYDHQNIAIQICSSPGSNVKNGSSHVFFITRSLSWNVRLFERSFFSGIRF